MLNEGQTRTALADTPANIFLNDCTNLVQEQRYEEYVARMSAQVNALYTKLPDKEADCCVSLLVHAVGRVPEERQGAAAATLAAALSQSDERAEDRLSALMSLYGMLSLPAAQLSVLLTAAAYAARNAAKCRASFCAAVRGKAARWVEGWKLAPAEALRLYLALSAAMRGSPDRPTTREHLSLVGLALALPGASAAAPEVAEAAAGALADYLRSPSIYTLDLLSLPGVAALAAHPTFGPLHKLVAAVVAGDVAGTRAASTPAALEAASAPAPAPPLTAEAILAKARMTALIAACAAAGTGVVALADLRAALDVPEDQVQPWIVRGVGAKLLEGRIDSLGGTFTVGRSTHPAFGPAQWAKLAAQLAALKDTVAAAATAVSSVRPPVQVSTRSAAAAAALTVAARVAV